MKSKYSAEEKHLWGGKLALAKDRNSDNMNEQIRELKKIIGEQSTGHRHF